MKPLVPLIVALVLISAATPSQPCEIPAAFTNQVVIDEGTLRVRYATDRVTYGPADIVSFYLSVENLGTSVYSVNWGVDPMDGHLILRPPFESFADCCATEADRAANLLAYYPETIYFFSPGTTINPGECRVWQRSTDLSYAEDVSPGTYTVLGGLFQAFQGPFVLPADGAALHITIANPLAVEQSTWGRVKALYR